MKLRFFSVFRVFRGQVLFAALLLSVFSVFRGESFVAIRAFIRGIRGYVLVAALLLWAICGDALVAAPGDRWVKCGSKW